MSPDTRADVMGVARSLHETGLLGRFVTTLALPDGLSGALGERIATRLRGLARSRVLPDWLDEPVDRIWVREAVRALASRARVDERLGHLIWEWSEAHFDARVADRYAGRVPCIYGCENASVETFEAQRRAGGLNLQWQVIAHHRAIEPLLHEEYAAYPEACTPYERFVASRAAHTRARKLRQIEAADLIVCISDNTRQTFIDAGVPKDKTVAVPTACPPVPAGDGTRRPTEPVVFLYAGALSVRKGLPYLLRAWRTLGAGSRAELWLVGKSLLPQDLLEGLPANVVVRPPVSHTELLQIYDRASALVLPTLAEGRASVVIEAMSRGLCVITTPNAGCTDLVHDAETGWEVPMRDATALANAMERLLSDPSSIQRMGDRAREEARLRDRSWFHRRHSEVIGRFLQDKGVG